MKHMNALFVLCIMMLYSFASSAQIQMQNRAQPQTSKSQLFRNVSQKVPAKITELDKAFYAREGSSIKLQFKNFEFDGIVTSSVKRYDHLHSVVIKSSSLDNAVFTISKRIEDNHTIKYVGRIIHENYADGYELTQDEDGGYILNKIKADVLLQDY